MDEPHTHKKRSSLRDVILGGQDGLVNVLGLSLGLFAAHATNRIILVAGLAAGFSEAISMGAVAYTSSLADRDFYLSVRAKEAKEIDDNPEKMKQYLTDMYRRKAFDEKNIPTMVADVTSSKEHWLDTIMNDDLQIQQVTTKGLTASSTVVAISALIGSIIPLLPFLAFTLTPAMLVAVIVGACILFAVGAYKAISLVGVWWKSGLQMLLIGMVAAFAGFLIGIFLKVN
jgi:VIT1/CCC1 family predicted Fe2+/Mn2+ transporter